LASGKFPYAAAKEVSKVEDPAKRAALISLAFDGMSYRQLIKQAKQMQDPTAEQTNADDTEFIERAKQVSKWLRKKPQLNQNDRKQLDAALRRIEDLAGKYTARSTRRPEPPGTTSRAALARALRCSIVPVVRDAAV